jgi:sugar phosphate permease
VLAFFLLLLVEPARGAHDARAGARVPAPPLGAALRLLAERPSYLVNTAAQIVYTFALGGLATWMPTYFVRERGLTLAAASSTFGLVLVAGGFAGTLLGGWGAGVVARRHPGADFVVSGCSLVASLAFTVCAILAPQPAVFWPAMFVSLLLLFVNIGPLNAAMANVLPTHVRTLGFAVTTMLMHALGDAISPWLIGEMSDRMGLTLPVLLAGCLLSVAGVILLAGRRTLTGDLRRAAAPQGGPAQGRGGVSAPGIGTS